MKLHFHKCEIKTFLLPCLGDNKIKMHCLKSFVVNQVIVIEKYGTLLPCTTQRIGRYSFRQLARIKKTIILILETVITNLLDMTFIINRISNILALTDIRIKPFKCAQMYLVFQLYD